MHGIILQEQDSSIFNSSKLDFLQKTFKNSNIAHYVASISCRSNRSILCKNENHCSKSDYLKRQIH